LGHKQLFVLSIQERYQTIHFFLLAFVKNKD
jgi:hypothetical protein